MRITRIVLKNFAAVYAGLSSREVSINFEEGKNKLKLFVGRNGSGKTAILSTLHPFAYQGSFDTRNQKDMILEGENGYKEIEYNYNGVIFLIKHFYAPTKTGWTVKSYISKDGQELNPNGNVTSFKEVVYGELHIKEDFMRLLRLGKNVINFTDMKTAERKKYITELLSNIDIYTKKFKKINEDTRFLKNNLTNVVKKLEKLHIIDLEDEKKRLKDKTEQLELVDKKISEDTLKFGELKGRKDAITSLSMGELKEELSQLLNEKKKLENSIVRIESRIDELPEVTEKRKRKLDQDLLFAEKEIASLDSTIKVNTVTLDRLYTTKANKEEQLSYLKSEEEIENLSQSIKETELHIKEISKVDFEKLSLKCSKDDLLVTLSLFEEIDKIVSEIYEFGKRSVTEVIKMIKSNSSVEKYASNKISKIDEKLGRLDVKRGYENENVMVLFVPQGCVADSCPYYNRYHKKQEEDGVMKKIIDLENEREYYLSMVAISKKIDYIFMLIRSNNALIERLPENFFLISKLLTNIENFTPIYDENHITSYISVIEDYEDYNSSKELLKELLEEKSRLKKSNVAIESIKKEYAETVELITSIAMQNDEVKEKRETVEKSLVDIRKEIDAYNVIHEMRETLEENKKKLDELSNLILNYQQQKYELENIHSEATEVSYRLSQNNKSREILISETKNMEYNIKEFLTLHEEMDLINSKFVELEYIKRSLTSNEGIPLLYIQLYFQETNQIVNQLLNDVYHGEIEIDDFNIDDSTFDVPYFKNGIRVDDIKSASQGEENFFSLALSFGLVVQSFEGYNIMLLDEIDGPFDTENRNKFIAILESQMETIGAEQVFLITHNGTFDNYPVDVVPFTDDADLNNQSVITIKK